MKNRHLESLAPLFTDDYTQKLPLILSSPSDVGVRKNLGRNGTRFGPEAILSNLKKLQNHLSVNGIAVHTVSDQVSERINFESAQKQEQKKIEEALTSNSFPRKIHLGGGHDHIFPFLAALAHQQRQIIILNLDAHCDTRIDDNHHSGTPFRNFDELKPKDCHLIQIGVHNFANSVSTLENLNFIKQSLLFKNNFTDTELLNQVREKLSSLSIEKDAIFIISLDADGLSSQEMEAVSAPNHNGFGHGLVRSLIFELKQNYSHHEQAFGIYEYNPIFDNLSQKGSRLLASLIYEFLEG